MIPTTREKRKGVNERESVGLGENGSARQGMHARAREGKCRAEGRTGCDDGLSDKGSLLDKERKHAELM